MTRRSAVRSEGRAAAGSLTQPSPKGHSAVRGSWIATLLPSLDRPPFPAGGPLSFALPPLAHALAGHRPRAMIEGLLRCIPNHPSQIRIHDAGIQPGTHARGALLERGATRVQHLPAILLRRAASTEGRPVSPLPGACGWNRGPHADSLRAWRAGIPPVGIPTGA